MIMVMARAAVRGLTALVLIAISGRLASAQTLVESSSETRFQLDLHVPDAVLATYLPDKWTSSVATQGPAKDCNLRAVFIDRVTINGPDGKPAGKGSNRLVYLVAPVKDPAGANVAMMNLTTSAAIDDSREQSAERHIVRELGTEGQLSDFREMPPD